MQKWLKKTIIKYVNTFVDSEKSIMSMELKDVDIESDHKYVHIYVLFNDDMEFSIVVPRSLLNTDKKAKKALAALIYLKMYESKDKLEDTQIGPVRLKILE